MDTLPAAGAVIADLAYVRERAMRENVVGMTTGRTIACHA
jgi:hypothetical protein